MHPTILFQVFTCTGIISGAQAKRLSRSFNSRAPCFSRPSAETSGYSFLLDNLDYPEIRHNQDLSVAGTRSGLAGARSGLFMEQIRIVKEMRAADVQRGRTARFIRPRFLAWENVPGAFSSGTPKGEDFRIVLEEICKISCDTVHVPRPHPWPWQFAGRIILGDSFSLAWRVLDAQHWGLAQRRSRIFLIADFGGLTAPQILFIPESLPGYSAQGP